jgi:hypothetical protein
MVHGEIVAVGPPHELADDLSNAYLGGAATAGASAHDNGSGAVARDSLR